MYFYSVTTSSLMTGLCLCPDSSVPLCLNTAENIHLIDAGLLINVGYPPFLGHKRDIDLIIAPEYSAGNMFEVTSAAVHRSGG